jgi:catechol 2,3-dioxygenase-like lactoylglutathione lyase family enzyme
MSRGEDKMFESTGGFHVCVVAQDFQRSIAFYEALGFSAAGQESLDDHPELRMQYLRHPCGGLVEVITYRNAQYDKPPARQRHEVGGLNHFGFHVTDLKKTVALLKKQGVEIVEEGSRGRYSFVFVRGLDNELIGFATIEATSPRRTLAPLG